MFVGVARLVLQIPGSHSLKDRRRVVRSLKDRLRAKLPVSVAEVGGLDTHDRAVIAVAMVSGSAARIDELLAVAAHMADTLRDAVLVERRSEIVSFGHEGSGVGAGAAGRLGEAP